MEASVSYLSCGVNQTPLCLDWGLDGTVCYAADTGLILYHPQSAAVTGASGKVHTERITCVRWVRSAGRTLVSTGVDGKVVVWVVDENKIENLIVLQPLAVLAHDDFVLLADATVVEREGEEQLLVVTATTDTLTTWLVSLHSGNYERLSSSAPPGSVYIMSLRLFDVVEARCPVLVCGGHDSRIHIMTADQLGIYKPACTLTGHEDWVMTLSVMTEDSGDYLLASGSKDSTVRLWRLSTAVSKSKVSTESKSENQELRVKSTSFTVPSDVKECQISVRLEAVLAGHEGQVSEVSWAQPVKKDQQKHQPLKLLTCSKTQDRSIIIWQPEGVVDAGDDSGGDEGGGLWLEVARLGEVGGNLEGYFACQFSPSANHLLGCSYQGGLHLWEQQCDNSWSPGVVVSGHFDQVADISWDPLGRYLLSTSKDQTTRLHARWVKNGGKTCGWHEVGRPQVHGYDLCCITSLESFTFASGAEEKVIRGFTAPANFIRNFGQICGMNVERELAQCKVGEGASVPSLGLSNKAVMKADLEEEQLVREEGREEVHAYFKPLSLSAPPTEDQLMQNTLWPEAAKLYGHGNELMALAASSDGNVLASSCRATNNIDAQIILWDTTSWQKMDSLSHHRLTVTHLSFSPNDQYLLGVSRDRSWSIFKKHPVDFSGGLGYTYRLMDFSQRKDTMHSRVIWRCCWMSDSSHFFTASRDKTVGVWAQDGEGGWVRKALLSETNEVTAVAVTDVGGDSGSDGSCLLLATGLECGAIKVRKFYPKEAVFAEGVLQIHHHHHNTVRCLRFRPAPQSDNVASVTLASCGNDKRVMLFEIKVK